VDRVAGPFQFAFPQLKDPHGYFLQFLDLISGLEIDITPDNAFFFEEVATQLQIAPLLHAVSPFTSTPITLANVIERIRNLGEHGLNTGAASRFIIDNWPSFESSPDLLTLPLQSLQDIFDSEDLEPTSESVLFDLICAIVSKRGREFAGLFRHVLFPQLDRSQISEFIRLVCYDEVPSCILSILDDRLERDLEGHTPPAPLYAPPPPVVPYAPPRVPQALPRPFSPEYIAPRAQPPPPEPRTRTVSIFHPQSEFKFYEHYDEDQRLDGVFALFTRERPHDWPDYLELAGGGTKEKMLSHILEFAEHLLFEYHWDNYDSREKIKASNAWLSVRFTCHRLVLSHYTIATSGKQFPHNSQPKSWKVEGSLDGRSWTLLAQVRKSERFKDKRMALATFAVTEKVRTPFSHFKLTQLENCAKAGAPNVGEMRINAIEFYGTLHYIQ
jgi:hypothetical protein